MLERQGPGGAGGGLRFAQISGTETPPRHGAFAVKKHSCRLYPRVQKKIPQIISLPTFALQARAFYEFFFRKRETTDR